MRKPMTHDEFRKVRIRRQEGIFALANDLHDAGFSTLKIESQTIGRAYYYMRVIIEQEELGADQLETIQEVAFNHDGRVHLRHDHKYGSRIAVWLPNAA